MFCLNDYLERFQNTFNKIKSSGLYDNITNLHVNVVGSNDRDLDFIKSVLLDKKIKITNFSYNTAGEVETLKHLHNVCICKENNEPILYLHSKGVSRVGNANVQAWINYMEHFAINKWRDCWDKLKQHTTCGVNLQFTPGVHYSGNFWWANSNYIKSLNQFEIAMKEWKVPHCGSVDRAYCEFWLLDNNSNNPATLHNSGVDHYAVLYEDTKYL